MHSSRDELCFVAHGKRLQQPLADGALAAFARDLLAGEIGHVEHIDGLLAEGRDMGRGDVEIEIGDLARHIVQQTRTVEPQVVFDNTLSDALTVIEINGLDRPGLLYDVTREISDLNLDIASAHIATFGEKAVDVFYVTDLTGKKITSSSRESLVRERLTKVLVTRQESALASV